jgi:hypothetical protein
MWETTNARLSLHLDLPFFLPIPQGIGCSSTQADPYCTLSSRHSAAMQLLSKTRVYTEERRIELARNPRPGARRT